MVEKLCNLDFGGSAQAWTSKVKKISDFNRTLCQLGLEENVFFRKLWGVLKIRLAGWLACMLTSLKPSGRNMILIRHKPYFSQSGNAH